MQKTQAHNLPALPEPAAHMYPSDLTRFAESETFAHAYSIAVGNPDERSQPLFTAEQMCAYASEARVGPVVGPLSGARSDLPSMTPPAASLPVSAPAGQEDARDAKRLKIVLDTFGKREDNMPLTDAERNLLAAFDDRGSYTAGMKLSCIDDALAAMSATTKEN